MSKMSQRYFELQEQAEFYDLELDFETLEFVQITPTAKKTYWDNYKLRDSDNEAGSPEQAWDLDEKI